MTVMSGMVLWFPVLLRLSTIALLTITITISDHVVLLTHAYVE